MGTKEIEPCKHCYLPRKMEGEKVSLGDRLIDIDKYVNWCKERNIFLVFDNAGTAYTFYKNRCL